MSDKIILSAMILLMMWRGAFGAEPTKRIADWRDIRQGSVICEQGYCDQPYIVVLGDGAWLCVFTTGAQKEGLPGQHIVASVSRDCGLTWLPPVDIEPADGPEASWAVPLVTPSGRVYVFYDYNGDHVNSLPSGKPARADMLGWYCYKYSDDGGTSWSQRYRLPVRMTACDRGNDWGGNVQIFWGICKPIVSEGSVYFAFSKLGRYLLDDGEGWFFRSDNVLTENDVSKVVWQMLPEGDRGLRGESFGSVQEEHNMAAMANGDLYCIFRTTTGRVGSSYSRDEGRTWSSPDAARYCPDGRPIKHPRACPRIWKCGNGKYLLWYHNHGGTGYADRNPAWVAGGVEKEGVIVWSQPEILLYDEQDDMRISYPDLIEQNGRYWVSETQKTVAKVHAVDAGLLEGMWGQFESTQQVVMAGRIAEFDTEKLAGGIVEVPMLPNLAHGRGFSIELSVCLDHLSAGQAILDSRDAAGVGLRVITVGDGAIRFEMSDGRYGSYWDSDAGVLTAGKKHHVVITVDGGPGIITYVIDGVLCDGGELRQFGWGRFAKMLSLPKVTSKFSVSAGMTRLRIYDRAIRTSEAVGNYHALQ